MKKRLKTTILAIALFVMAGMLTVNDATADTVSEDAKEISEAGEQTRETVCDSGIGGVIHFENRLFKISDKATSSKLRRFSSLDSEYDSRTDKYARVKNQLNTGLCWAFAATTVGEKEYWRGVAGAEEYQPFSPAHLGYFFYNRVNDPLGNTAGDKNVISASGEDYKSIGGANIITFQALANWTGMALETTVPFNGGNPAIPASDLAYRNVATLASAKVFDSDDDRNDVKQAIYENGSVIVDYYAGESFEGFYNRETSAYYCDDLKYSNHEVAIVGWDDDFSKDNFNISPESDGAWLVQNSWGESFGNNGYFYLSYEDTSITNYVSLDFQNSTDYDYNYQYDGNANLGGLYFSEGEKISNVYCVPTDKGNHLLEAVGLTTWDSDRVDYNIKIYSNVMGSTDPEDGVEECSFDVSTDNAGYHTFKLTAPDYGERPVYLKAGAKYSIVLTILTATEKTTYRGTNRETFLGVETSYTGSDISFKSTRSRNQSYWRVPGTSKWQDLYDNQCSARIKGLASRQSTEVSPQSIDLQGQSSDGKIYRVYGNDRIIKVKFSPSDTTIRNIAWKSSNPAVAEVTGEGKIVYHGLGETVITATTDNGMKASRTLVVTKPVLSIPTSTSTNLYGYDDMKFSWTKVPLATGYYIEYKKSTWSAWKSLGATASTYIKKANLADGAKYYFRVRPYIKINGVIYKSSAYKTGTGVYTLKRVARPSVKKKSKNYTRITWSNIAGESGYQIARSRYKTKKFSIVKTCSYKYKTTTIKTTRNRTYYYKIRAYKTVNGSKVYAPWSSLKAYKLKQYTFL